MRKTLILAAAAALFTIPAIAAETQQQPAQPVDDGGVIICKSMQAATGSRIGARKVCMTRNEWRAQQEADRQLTDQAASASLRSLPPEAGGQ